MRDIFLLLMLIASSGFVLVYPFAGVIAWGWLSLMVPQSMVYSFLHAAPINFGVAIETLGMWLTSGEKKRMPGDKLPMLMLAFVIWMALNSAVAPYPEWSADKFDLTMKTYPFIFLLLFMAITKARIQAIVWVVVISLGYYGVKGGAFTIMTGGNFHVVGEGGIYRDNNQLALAMVMVLPLIHYLMSTVNNKLLRIGLLVTLGLQTIAVLGSYSRGGFLALFSMLTIFWLRSKNKFTYLILGAVLVAGALSVMPPQFYERMNTIQHAGNDESFMGRVQAWQVCFKYAVDHFPFGTGFNANYHPQIYNYYFPGATTHLAHSIYFQVLGDHGFPGLFLYLMIAWVALRNARVVVKRCKNQPNLRWAGGLATALEISQIAFYVGGASLSVPYWDGILTVQALTSVLRAITDPKIIHEAEEAEALAAEEKARLATLAIEEQKAAAKLA